MSDVQAALLSLAEACRRGFETLTDTRWSMFYEFPEGACGPSAEIVGRIVHEQLGLEGVYVCGMDHPSLPDDFTHAWFEVSGVILDVTHDQFAGTGITGWLFPLDSAWHGQFSSLDRRDGYCTAMNWPSYPKDAYQAALEALTKERTVDPSLT